MVVFTPTSCYQMHLSVFLSWNGFTDEICYMLPQYYHAMLVRFESEWNILTAETYEKSRTWVKSSTSFHVLSKKKVTSACLDPKLGVFSN